MDVERKAKSGRKEGSGGGRRQGGISYHIISSTDDVYTATEMYL